MAKKIFNWFERFIVKKIVKRFLKSLPDLKAKGLELLEEKSGEFLEYVNEKISQAVREFIEKHKKIYIVWRGFETDNFTWINSGDWDIRCSHLHDVGCKYHGIVRVKLNERELRTRRFLVVHHNKIICNDIPPKYLKIEKITGHEINNMFYRMLKATKAPKYVQIAYRAGVAFNFGWFFSGKEKIDLNNLYKEAE